MRRVALFNMTCFNGKLPVVFSAPDMEGIKLAFPQELSHFEDFDPEGSIAARDILVEEITRQQLPKAFPDYQMRRSLKTEILILRLHDSREGGWRLIYSAGLNPDVKVPTPAQMRAEGERLLKEQKLEKELHDSAVNTRLKVAVLAGVLFMIFMLGQMATEGPPTSWGNLTAYLGSTAGVVVIGFVLYWWSNRRERNIIYDRYGLSPGH